MAPNSNPKAWAYALKAREQRGDRLSLLQRKAWREAIEPRDPLLYQPSNPASKAPAGPLAPRSDPGEGGGSQNHADAL